MTSEKDEEIQGEENFYAALSHDLRRKIIKMIGDDDSTSFTKLKEVLQTSTGTIYHHLEVLKDLVYQKKNKKYYLTSLGTHAYRFLQQNIDTIESTKITDEKIKSPFLKSVLNLTPKRLFLEDPRQSIFCLLISIVCLALGAVLASLSGQITFILFFQDAFLNPSDFDPGIQIVLGITFVVNYLVLFVLVELFCWLFFAKKENSLKVMLNMGSIYFPIVIYLVIHYIFFILDMDYLTIIDNILLILFQIWSLWLMTYNLSVNKYIKIERALIVTLIIHYGSFIVLFMLRL